MSDERTRDTADEIARYIDAALNGWERQIDAGRPVSREQVAALRQKVQEGIIPNTRKENDDPEE